MRVLFAGDQIVTGSDPDPRVRAEVIKELSKTRPDAAQAFEEDHKWFVELVDYLKNTHGFEIVPVNRFKEALQCIKKPGSFDVAVIDLTWTGDSEGDGGGLELLKQLATQNKSSARYLPAIAFSEKFKDDPEVLQAIRDSYALPIQKDYTKVGQRTLAATIRLLTQLRPSTAEDDSLRGQQRQLSALQAEARRTGRLFDLVLCVSLVCFIALAILTYASGIPDIPKNVWLGLGASGGGFLFWAWRRHRRADTSRDELAEKVWVSIYERSRRKSEQDIPKKKRFTSLIQHINNLK